MSLIVQQSQSTPKPERRVEWLYQNENLGHGVLRLSTKEGGGWRRLECFARPVKGRMGRVWQLFELDGGRGAPAGFVVNLTAWACDCEAHERDMDCLHVRALLALEHHGRL